MKLTQKQIDATAKELHSVAVMGRIKRDKAINAEPSWDWVIERPGQLAGWRAIGKHALEHGYKP